MSYRVRSNTGCDHLSNEYCERCERDRQRTWREAPAPATRVFRVGVYEHLQGPLEPPITIETPKQLRDEAHTRGLQSEYLQESIWQSGKRPPRWL